MANSKKLKRLKKQNRALTSALIAQQEPTEQLIRLLMTKYRCARGIDLDVALQSVLDDPKLTRDMGYVLCGAMSYTRGNVVRTGLLP